MENDFTNLKIADHEIPSGLKDPRIVVSCRKNTKRAAAFRVLKYQIEQKGDRHSLLVTGPTPKCGKTLVALNLALAIAENTEQPTLLLEANAPHQALASIFRFQPPVCLMEQSVKNQNESQPTWNLVDVKATNLHVAAISTEQKTPWPTIQAFLQALQHFKTMPYEKIVIDAGSILGSADINMIQDHVDGVLMVVKSQLSKESDITEATKQLGHEKILGTILVE